MDDLATGRTHPVESSLQVIDREVHKAETVARASTSLVDPKRCGIPMRLPPLTLRFLAGLKLHREHTGPKRPRPLRIVRGKLHEPDWGGIRLAGRLGGHDVRV